MMTDVRLAELIGEREFTLKWRKHSRLWRATLDGTEGFGDDIAEAVLDAHTRVLEKEGVQIS